MKNLLLLLTLSTMICTNIEAARTLNIKYTGTSLGLSFKASLPGIKSIFDEDIFFDQTPSGSYVVNSKKPFSEKNVTNNSFALQFREFSHYFTYTVPAGKDGDTICLEVNDTSAKECSQSAAKK